MLALVLAFAYLALLLAPIAMLMGLVHVLIVPEGALCWRRRR